MTAELERRLFEAYCRAAGVWPPPSAVLHPADDMYRFGSDLGLEDERRLAMYLRGALEVERVLEHLLRSLGRSLDACESVLEFACGFGRFTRLLTRRVPAERVWCSDVLPGTTEFVARHFGVNVCASVTDPAALELPRRFDLIWVGSLFSHLPPARFEAWLARLYAALTPGGLLVFSTHGAHVSPAVPKHLSGFTFLPSSESAVLDTAEYGTAFVTPEVVRTLARRLGAAAHRHVERELWDIQDVHVLAGSAAPDLTPWSNAPLVRGSIERAAVSGTGHAWIGGWARLPADVGPVASVRLHVGGLEVDALLSEPRRLPSESPEGSGFWHSEWYIEGPASELAPGVHPLCALGASPPAGGGEAPGVVHAFDVRALRVPPPGSPS